MPLQMRIIGIVSRARIHGSGKRAPRVTNTHECAVGSERPKQLVAHERHVFSIGSPNLWATFKRCQPNSKGDDNRGRETGECHTEQSNAKDCSE